MRNILDKENQIDETKKINIISMLKIKIWQNFVKWLIQIFYTSKYVDRLKNT